jgi:hypothetical protein
MVHLNELNKPMPDLLELHRPTLLKREQSKPSNERSSDAKYKFLIHQVKRSLNKNSNYASRVDSTKHIRSGVRQAARTTLIGDMFKQFITPEIAAKVIQHTNDRIRSAKDSSTLLTEIDFYGFIGVRLMAAANQDNITQLWRSGNPAYNGAMSRNRYVFIGKHMQFESAEITRKAPSCAYAMKAVHDMFAKQCRKVYKPSDHMVVNNIRFDLEGKFGPFRAT